jgi:hypothetical protein
MWIIFCNETGLEVDSVETIAERNASVRYHDDWNSWDYTHSYRWENA